MQNEELDHSSGFFYAVLNYPDVRKRKGSAVLCDVTGMSRS